LGGLFAIALLLAVLLYISRTASLEKTKVPQGQVITPTPTTTKNPFNQTTNPFNQPTTYQNPFSSTSSGTQEYKNPFNQLR